MSNNSGTMYLVEALHTPVLTLETRDIDGHISLQRNKNSKCRDRVLKKFQLFRSIMIHCFKYNLISSPLKTKNLSKGGNKMVNHTVIGIVSPTCLRRGCGCDVIVKT